MRQYSHNYYFKIRRDDENVVGNDRYSFYTVFCTKMYASIVFLMQHSDLSSPATNY